MAAALDILLIDDHLEGDRTLAEFLGLRCRRVNSASSVREGLAALERFRITGARYHAVFANVAHLAIDGLAMLRELARCQDRVPVVFTADYHAVDAALEAEAQRLGVLAILDKPVDLAQIEELLVQLLDAIEGAIPVATLPPEPPQGSTASYTAAPPAQAQPHAALEPVARPPAALVPTTGFQQRNNRSLLGSGRTRRSVDITTPAPGLPGTSGVRRLTPPPVVRSIPPLARSGRRPWLDGLDPASRPRAQRDLRRLQQRHPGRHQAGHLHHGVHPLRKDAAHRPPGLSRLRPRI